MSKSHRERDYILINLEMFPFNIPRPCLVSEKIARFFGLTPGCTVRRPDAIDVEIAVMNDLFGTEVGSKPEKQEEIK